LNVFKKKYGMDLNMFKRCFRFRLWSGTPERSQFAGDYRRFGTFRRSRAPAGWLPLERSADAGLEFVFPKKVGRCHPYKGPTGLGECILALPVLKQHLARGL